MNLSAKEFLQAFLEEFPMFNFIQNYSEEDFTIQKEKARIFLSELKTNAVITNDVDDESDDIAVAGKDERISSKEKPSLLAHTKNKNLHTLALLWHDFDV